VGEGGFSRKICRGGEKPATKTTTLSVSEKTARSAKSTTTQGKVSENRERKTRGKGGERNPDEVIYQFIERLGKPGKEASLAKKKNERREPRKKKPISVRAASAKNPRKGHQGRAEISQDGGR